MTTWLHDLRLQAAFQAVQERQPRRLLDLGCGSGDLLVRLLKAISFERVVGIDHCSTALANLSERLDKRTGAGAHGIELVFGSILEVPRQYTGFDCALLIETIEHIDKGRHSLLEQALFVEARPTSVIVTTPNAEFNALLGVPRTRFRHPDHRFEWTRPEFRRWGEGIARRTKYNVSFSDIAGCHPELGGASQMAAFDIWDTGTARR